MNIHGQWDHLRRTCSYFGLFSPLFFFWPAFTEFFQGVRHVLVMLKMSRLSWLGDTGTTCALLILLSLSPWPRFHVFSRISINFRREANTWCGPVWVSSPRLCYTNIYLNLFLFSLPTPCPTSSSHHSPRWAGKFQLVIPCILLLLMAAGAHTAALLSPGAHSS